MITTLHDFDCKNLKLTPAVQKVENSGPTMHFQDQLKKPAFSGFKTKSLFVQASLAFYCIVELADFFISL